MDKLLKEKNVEIANEKAKYKELEFEIELIKKQKETREDEIMVKDKKI